MRPKSCWKKNWAPPGALRPLSQLIRFVSLQMQLDPRIAALGTANLPCYPSLLKQQLRELVLRRKSLVREEPEDDPTAALAATAAAFAARNNVPGSAFSAAGSSASSSSAGKKRRGHREGTGALLAHSQHCRNCADRHRGIGGPSTPSE